MTDNRADFQLKNFLERQCSILSIPDFVAAPLPSELLEPRGDSEDYQLENRGSSIYREIKWMLSA